MVTLVAAWLILASNIGLDAVEKNKPPINSVQLYGTVQSREVIGNALCIVRVANSSQPGDVYDVLVTDRVCRRLAEGSQALMSGYCTPILTTYGFMCQPVMNKVTRFQ